MLVENVAKDTTEPRVEFVFRGFFSLRGIPPPLFLRDGVKKSKWKFKMAFAMKGGRGLEGVSSAIYLF